MGETHGATRPSLLSGIDGRRKDIEWRAGTCWRHPVQGYQPHLYIFIESEVLLITHDTLSDSKFDRQSRLHGAVWP